jgi:hypothetical protein
VRQLTQLALIGVALAGAAACAHVQAAAPRPSPLDVPAPPPRVVVPPSADVTDPEPPAPATTPAPVAPVHPRDTTTPVRPPEKPPTTPPAAAATPPADPSTSLPLETTSDTSALESQTNALLANAKRDLQHVDASSLSRETKAQYDRATSFVRQAESALRERNYTYARNMAEKAAALAGQLPKGRAGQRAIASAV